jgi:hypothetical protein
MEGAIAADAVSRKPRGKPFMTDLLLHVANHPRMNSPQPTSRHSASCLRILAARWPRSRIPLPWEGRETPQLRPLRDASNRTIAKIKLRPLFWRSLLRISNASCHPTCGETASYMRCIFRRPETGRSKRTRLANARSPNACERARSRCRRHLALLRDHALTSSPKPSGECNRPSGGLSYLEDVAAPVPLEDKETASLPVEADVDHTDTSQHGKSRPSFLDHLVAQAFNDIRDRVRYRAYMASTERTARRNRGLQSRRKAGAVIDAKPPE